MNSNLNAFYLLLGIFSIIGQAFSADLKFLNLRFKPIAQNIDTKNLTQCAPTSTPLYVTATASTMTLLVNTGQSVQSTIPTKIAANATGGVLGQEAYELVSFLYYWTDHGSNHGTGTTIDGKGYRYEARLFNVNVKYDNLTEAVRHDDGIFDFVFVFDICSTTNEPFDKISRLIRKIPIAGSFTLASVGTQITAIDFIPLNTIYYTYSGQVEDVVTTKRYKCSTVIVIAPNPQYCITRKQFDDTFGPLPFVNTLKRDSSPAKVSRCSVVTQKIFQ